MGSSTGTQRWRGYELVTDNGQFAIGGRVMKCTGTAVTVLDQRTNATFRIPQDRVRPMSESQVAVYYSKPAIGEVPEQERLKRQLEVQASWGPQEAGVRRHGYIS